MTNPTRARPTAKRHRLSPWLVFFAPVLALALLLAVTIATGDDSMGTGGAAPDFALPDTPPATP